MRVNQRAAAADILQRQREHRFKRAPEVADNVEPRTGPPILYVPPHAVSFAIHLVRPGGFAPPDPASPRLFTKQPAALPWPRGTIELRRSGIQEKTPRIPLALRQASSGSPLH